MTMIAVAAGLDLLVSEFLNTCPVMQQLKSCQLIIVKCGWKIKWKIKRDNCMILCYASYAGCEYSWRGTFIKHHCSSTDNTAYTGKHQKADSSVFDNCITVVMILSLFYPLWKLAATLLHQPASLDLSTVILYQKELV